VREQIIKVSLGMSLKKGPWGGGNQFGHAMSNKLKQEGWNITYDLKDRDLDIIILIDPRKQSSSATYSHRDIEYYLKYINPKAIVIHRINECDERKGTSGVNNQIINGNRCADYSVFISSWLKSLYDKQGINNDNSSVVFNGADSKIFYAKDRIERKKNVELRLVTHHWGANWLKGFDIYDQLDQMLSQNKWRDLISFTYIGQLPQNFNFNNAKYIEPLSGIELADELRRHHVYLTASRNEPAGMHHIEGALCHLPLLYVESGALPEYCHGFGISFTPEYFEEKLLEMMDNYDHWISKMPSYPHTAQKMCGEYYTLFTKLVENRNEILEQRMPLPKSAVTQKYSYLFNEVAKGIKSSVKVILGKN